MYHMVAVNGFLATKSKLSFIPGSHSNHWCRDSFSITRVQIKYRYCSAVMETFDQTVEVRTVPGMARYGQVWPGMARYGQVWPDQSVSSRDCNYTSLGVVAHKKVG